MCAREAVSRREFVKAAAAVAGVLAGGRGEAQPRGERPRQAEGIEVLNPRGRVPVSLIIDDSTCLVNMAHFGIPQFGTAWPERYKQDWRALPREIPDSFVRKFARWCREHGVKGKYTIVPYPACVGWVDRTLPGWSQRQLEQSLELVRESMMPDWDIHPEMISHTWVIDIKTGRPYPEQTGYYIENAGWSQDKSADELAAYMAYALRILKNVGLDCEGITTPGGFGSRNRENLARATLEACRDVFGAEVPHYFRDLFTDGRSVAPLVQYASGIGGGDPKCVVSIIGCTGDWFGGWDGLTPGSVEKFITEDLKGGRLPEVIDRGEPAILVCHWPGIYFNGQEIGFKIFKEVVRRLEARYDNLIWMKLSEIARYWAARELTSIERWGSKVVFSAPFGTRRFTVRGPVALVEGPGLRCKGRVVPLKRVDNALELEDGCWCRDGGYTTVCFELPRGETMLEL